MQSLKLGPADGTLSVHTGVVGGAAKVGHSLVIVVSDWSAEVQIDGADPIGVVLVAEVGSMAVQSGSGGLRPLSGLDKEMIHSNAMRSMKVKNHPQIRFESESMSRDGDTVAVTGSATIAGNTKPLSAQLHLGDDGDSVRVTTAVPIDQNDFGVKPYSLMFGQLRVADTVEVRLDVTVALGR